MDRDDYWRSSRRRVWGDEIRGLGKEVKYQEDSHEYQGGRGKDIGEQKGNGVHGAGKDGICWERVEGRGIGGTCRGGGWISANTLNVEVQGIERLEGGRGS